ncbi:hypothetical protein E5Q10_06305 [Streptococcus pneumoniae]|nr:hypothetical protein EZ481_10000 [Streptococcus pneumoniae]QEL29345.1 hypothetical protein E5Q10_06305 [Streptococcus pneumoniae]UKP25164.1 hypothetical protein EQH42_06340 [Streptococcus pneumoniae]
MIVILLPFSLLKIKKGEQYSTVLQNNFIKKKNPAKEFLAGNQINLSVSINRLSLSKTGK